MARGDRYFEFYTSGSTATSAATIHNFFGAYQGLSVLNSQDVVHIQVQASANAFLIGAPGKVSNNLGLKIYPAASVVDLPAMNVGAASLLQFARDGANNSEAQWVVWRRVN